jgi:hypothetical protein
MTKSTLIALPESIDVEPHSISFFFENGDCHSPPNRGDAHLIVM